MKVLSKPKWWGKYLANKGEAEKHATRCMPADQLREMVEACDGWLSDHRAVMDPEQVKRLDTCIRSARYALSRPFGWWPKKMAREAGKGKR